MSEAGTRAPSVGAPAKLVDTHIHLYDTAVAGLTYPWNRPHPFLGDQLHALPDRATVDDFQRESAGEGVTHAVYVQCADSRSDPVLEVDWVTRTSTGSDVSIAVVGYAHLTDPGVSDILESHARSGVRGIRDLQFDRPSELATPQHRRGLRALAALGLLYELRVTKDEVDIGLTVCDEIPDTPVVLTHAGLPMGRDAAYLDAWRAGLRRLASAPNLVCKVSGLFQGNAASGVGYDATMFRDIVGFCVETFGVERCVVGSNWPVDALWMSYPKLIGAYREALSDLTPGEAAAVFATNARRVYRLA